MFGPRLNRVFASRNNALWWSAMVLVTAYCVVAEPPSGPIAQVDDGDVVKSNSQKKANDPWADMKDVAKKREELLR